MVDAERRTRRWEGIHPPPTRMGIGAGGTLSLSVADWYSLVLLLVGADSLK